MIGWILIFLVRAYQVTLSPWFGRCCRYYPSCSQYCITAIEKHGSLKGLALAAWRLCRCNPFSHGGVDFVPEPAGAVRGDHAMGEEAGATRA